MGSGSRPTASAWKAYTTKTTSHAKTVRDIYTRRGMSPDFNPRNIKVREARDSVNSPNSTALIVALDVTGSMNRVLDAMAREGLTTLATEVYARKPIPDPHILYMGVGDFDAGDKAPLQCTQFEVDEKMFDQLKDIWLESGGGGNHYEGYNLPWYFAAMKTSIDCFEKRGKKGYLFTVGDEETPKGISIGCARAVFGDEIQSNLTNEQLLQMVSRSYHVYHIIVEEGSHYQHCGDAVDRSWRNLLGQHVINLSDHTKLSEVITSAIQLNEGADKDDIIKSWDGSTAIVVENALKNAGAMAKASEGGGVVNFD